jgi:hypothetical protein
MILSVHLADVGLASLGRTPKPKQVPGLRYGLLTMRAPLSGSLLPAPEFSRAGLVAAWEDDESLDEFLSVHPLAQKLQAGWHVRLQPLHAYGSWSALPGIENDVEEVSDEEPVAVLTLGRLRKSQALRFLRASAAAEALAVSDPAVLASTGLARPPGVLATFSLWETVAAMRDYAQGKGGDGHAAASRAHKLKPFHSESLFARFRPYRSQGSWDGRDPLQADPVGDNRGEPLGYTRGEPAGTGEQ